jgi:MFS family permease
MLCGSASTLSCRRLLTPRRLPVSLRSTLCTVSRATAASPVAAGSPAAASASFLSDDRIRVDPSYNRWLQLVPACVAGVGIGTYASVPAVLGPFVCRAQGVVAQAPTDFAMSDLLPVATMMPLVAGLAAATLASQSEQFGHRRLAFVCSFLYPSAVYGLSALAVNAASLPLFAASYALLGGLGFYCGYPQLPPFLASTWFPDRRGLVVSIYMTSFGSGMLFAVPVLQALLAHFRAAPVRLGGLDPIT